MQTPLSDLNARFTYRSERGEEWRILKDNGNVYGDCEDYSLTLAWLASGRSMLRFWWGILTFRFVIWQCRSPGGAGHAVMWVRGHGWIDNITREFVSRRYLKEQGYRLHYPMLAPIIVLKFILRRRKS